MMEDVAGNGFDFFRPMKHFLALRLLALFQKAKTARQKTKTPSQ
jgi:hypothetical protein